MKSSLIYLLSFFTLLFLAACNSTGYEIEELLDPVDTVRIAANTEIKKDIETQKPEIKEEIGGRESTEKRDLKLYSVQIGAFENENNAAGPPPLIDSRAL